MSQPIPTAPSQTHPLAEAHAHIAGLVQSSGAPVGLPSGLLDLDRLTGGFLPGQFVVIGGRPGTGKSSLALGCIEASIFGLLKSKGASPRILHVALDMTARDVSFRLICSRAGVNWRKLAEGFVSRENLGDIAAAEKDLRDAPLVIDAGTPRTAADIEALATHLHAKDKLGLVVVDCIQAVKGPEIREARDQIVTDAAWTLKRLALSLGVPVIATSHLSRECAKDDRCAKLHDLAESGAIEQAANIVLFIEAANPKGYRGRDEEDVEIAPGLFPRSIVIAKNNGGPTGDIPVYFHKPLCKFVTPVRQQA